MNLKGEEEEEENNPAVTVTLLVVEASLISSTTLQLCEEKANSFAKFAVGKHHFVAEKQAGRRVALAGINSHTNPPVQYLCF
jgi:hypothetical protein